MQVSVLCKSTEVALILSLLLYPSEVVPLCVCHSEFELFNSDGLVELLDDVCTMDRHFRYIIEKNQLRIHINKRGHKKITKNAQKRLFLSYP